MTKTYFLIAMALVIGCMAPPAFASEKVEDISVVSPAQVNEYSRQGSKIAVTFTSADGGDAKATVQCGDPTGGMWTPIHVEGFCYKGEFAYDVPTDDADRIIATDLAGKTILSRDIVPGTEGKVTKIRYAVELLAKDSDIVFNTYSLCSGGAVKKVRGADGSDVKRHCVFNYEGPSDAIVGASSDPSENDDMFRIKAGASGFLEYLDRSSELNNKRLRWMSRDSGDEPIMVPSGPHAGANAYKDFDIFQRREPGGVSTQDACYPLNISLCEGVAMPPTQPPTRGLCGSAHGKSYATAADIPASARCYIGSATEVTEGDTTFTWSCKGIPESEPSDSCTADKETDITRRPPRCNPETRGSKKLDVVFLADNTGSMGGVIASVQAKASSILAQMAGDNPRFHPLDVRFAVANYLHDPSEGSASSSGPVSCPDDPMGPRAMEREYIPDDPSSPCASGGGIEGQPFTLQQALSPSRPSAKSAIDGWKAMGGGDLPEGQMYAFKELMGGETGWRSDAYHFIIWMGDAPGHTATVSLEEVKSILREKYIYVMALDNPLSYTTPEGVTSVVSAMDSSGQATEIVNATGGIVADISSLSEAQLADLIVDEVYRGFTQVCVPEDE